MDWNLFWIITIGVITVAATTVVPIIVFKRQKPKRRLTISCIDTLLFKGTKVGTGRLAVTYLQSELSESPPVTKREISEPYLVTVRLWPSGRDDISSKNFNEHIPIVMTFGCDIIAESLVQGEENGDHEFKLRDDIQSLELGHGNFQSDGKGCQVTFLTEGKPEFHFSDPLTEARVVDNRNIQRRELRYSSVLIPIILSLFPLLIIGLLKIYPSYSNPFAYSIGLGVIGGVVIAALINATLLRSFRREDESSQQN